MSDALLFAIGCVVTVAVMTGVFILGFSQFLRWEDDDTELATVPVTARSSSDSRAA